METKVCPKCKEEKLVSGFYVDTRFSDGFYFLCKKCKIQEDKRYRLAKEERLKSRVLPSTKVCERCQIEKPAEDFYKDIKKTAGLSIWCKQCISEAKEVKKCGHCKVEKVADENFTYRTLYENGKPKYDAWCRTCYMAKRKKVRDRQREDGYCAICGAPSVTYRCNKCQTEHIKANNFRSLEKKRDCIDRLGGKCSVCGIKSPVTSLYDFHHPTDSKETEVSKLLRRRMNIEKIYPEVDKCILLCVNCHRVLHNHISRENGSTKKGTVRLNSIRRGKKDSAIKLMGGCCSRCGSSFEEQGVYEFHHIVSTNREICLARMFTISKWEEIEDELHKCVMLCANCHRTVHWEMSYKIGEIV